MGKIVKRSNKNIKRKNLKGKNKRVFKTERKPERQSQRIKNRSVGIKLPNIDFDKQDLILSGKIKDHSLNYTTSKPPQPSKQLSKVPSLNKKTSNSSDTIEVQKKYYNQIAIDKKFEKKVSLTGYNKDKHGNLAGNNFDLAMDYGFTGKVISVLQFYSFNFNLTEAALKEKGFDLSSEQQSANS